jgi:hypothetical protein
MSTEILDKLAKVLTQAERAATNEEAEAFFQKAQLLASKYSIDLAMARAHTHNKEKREQPTQKRVQIGEKGKPLNATFCELFMSIGRANDLKFNIAHNSTYVIAFGFPSDIELTEALYAHISMQMIEMANEFIKGGTWKGDTTWDLNTYRYKPVHSRVARRCFYEAFTSRIGSRLREAKAQAEAEAKATEVQHYTAEEIASTGTDIVLKGKAVEVSDFYKSTSTARGSWRGGSGNTYTSNTGRSAGHSAANNARLSGQRGIGGGKKAIQ